MTPAQTGERRVGGRDEGGSDEGGYNEGGCDKGGRDQRADTGDRAGHVPSAMARAQSEWVGKRARRR
ncbi:hypothetical protein DENSPDRAFT_836574 [Dentipellis sp. KUC8613]|nr:hypothetical protein DENSPDRAFT_836574 [Dentipellis sp. KUC8613]